MSKALFVAMFAYSVLVCNAQSSRTSGHGEAEYYVAAYAQHYRLPVGFVRAVIAQESGWRPCAISGKGAAGLMQLMPQTAARLGVQDRCNIKENISGGVRYLAWLSQKFHGDLRLVAAAYLAGENVVERRGLLYRNQEVVKYVSQIRGRCDRQLRVTAITP
jgi:soluble lytic murein transglycosylase-like protein